jgi:hypothetical protein
VSKRIDATAGVGVSVEGNGPNPLWITQMQAKIRKSEKRRHTSTAAE